MQDVLENEQVKLDNMFKFSLMQDIVRVCDSQSAYYLSLFLYSARMSIITNCPARESGILFESCVDVCLLVRAIIQGGPKK